MNDIIVLQQIPRVFDALYNKDILSTIGLEELRDAFRPSQIKSKIWLLDNLRPHLNNSNKICVLGSWFGFIASCLYDIGLSGITDIDCDARCQLLSQTLNSRNKSYVRVSDDACKFDLHEFDVIVNTSAEHMNNDWFYNVKSGSLVAIQTNDIVISQHINSVNSLSEAVDQYPMQLLFHDQLQFKSYRRFMLIGIKT